MSDRFEFTADTNVEEALELDERVGKEISRLGLKCVECAASMVETFRDVARYHERDLDEILAALNSLRIEKKPEKKSGP